jgi:uncharacterized protein YoxC
MKFTSDTDTIIKLQTLNKTINNLEKTYQGLLIEAKNIANKQEKIVDKIEHIEQLNELIKNIGGYEKIHNLLQQIQEISPFLKNLENELKNILPKLLEEMLENLSPKTTINLDKTLDNPLENRIENLEKQVEYLSNQNRELLALINLTNNSEESISNEISEETIDKSSTSIWDNIINKEPLVAIIKKYAETYRIEKLYTATTGQLVYGITRSTIRIIIILQNMKAKSIILRDEDKRKELNLTPQEAHFIYQYMDSYLQVIS